MFLANISIDIIYAIIFKSKINVPSKGIQTPLPLYKKVYYEKSHEMINRCNAHYKYFNKRKR